MSQTAEVVVVGGGVNGASIAYALAAKGVKVVLVEKGALASGASGRSSALVRMHYTNEWDARLAWASFPVFRHWAELMGGPPVFTHTGFVNVVAPPLRRASPAERRDAPPHRGQHHRDHPGRAAGAPALRQRGRRRRGGLRAGERLRQSGRDGRGLPPPRGGAGRARAPVDRGDADRPAREPGHRRGDDRGPHRRGRTWWWRRAPGRARLCEEIGLALPARPEGHRHGGGERARRSCAIRTWSSSTTCRATTSGRRAAASRWSACRARSGTSIPTRSAPGCRPQAAGLGAQLLTHRIPAMERATLSRGYRAFDGYSPDRHAILGAVDGIDGLYLATAFSGSGLQDRPARSASAWPS